MRVRYKNLAIIGVIVGTLLVSTLSMATKAQDADTNSVGTGNGFRISPVRYEVFMDRGESAVYNLEVENPTKSPIEASVIINDFEAGDQENGEPKILYDANTSSKGNSFKSLASTPESVTIAANSKVTVPVTLKTVTGTNPGGYYGAVRVVPKNSEQKNVSLAASVGTIFLVRIEGQLTESLEVEEFTAAKNGSTGRFFVNSGEMTIVTRLKNTGNIHVKPFGKIQVTDRSGKIVEEYEFNNVDPRANVLPNSTRKFEDKLKNQKWIGKYTITANLGYGTGGSLLTEKNTFWVISTWVFITGIVLVVVLIVSGYLLYRKFALGNKHKIRNHRR